jgi:NAD nucleotidase, C-terminal domain
MWFLWMQQVVPETVFNTSLVNIPYYYINDGGLRYNLYSGPVNKNDIYTVNPFSDHYSYFPNMPGTQLQQFKDFVLSGGTQELQVPRSDRVGIYILENGPGWYFSLNLINSSATYDLMCADYDCTTMQPVLQQLFPQSDWTVQVYPTNLTSTSALTEYIQARMSCRASCTCPTTSPE